MIRGDIFNAINSLQYLDIYKSCECLGLYKNIVCILNLYPELSVLTLKNIGVKSKDRQLWVEIAAF